MTIGRSYRIPRKERFKVSRFEYFYMAVMVIYMAQINESTARMVGGLSGNLVPFIIPVFLTIILLIRRPISFMNRNLAIILGLFTIWAFAVLIKFKSFTSTADLSYMFFLFYAIIVAYIHVRVYKRKLFQIYEHIMVWAAGISLPFWLLNIVLLGHYEPTFLQETSLGYNVLYIYNWISQRATDVEGVVLITLRNSGLSWEPGRFAIMIDLAILFNLSRNGLKLKGNRSLIILLLALASTQSTTGYFILFFLFPLFSLKRNLKSILSTTIVFLTGIVLTLSLDFMSEKTIGQLDVESSLTEKNQAMQYYNATVSGDEYIASVGRFESIYFDWLNVKNDPLLGHSRTRRHSYFYNNLSSNYSLPSGLVKIFAQFGIPLGLFIYFFLFYSSFKISNCFPVRKRLAFAIVVVMSLISYDIWCTPVFTAFWLFGLFYDNKYLRYIIGNEDIRSDNRLK